MTKLKKILRSPICTAALFLLAGLMLLTSTIGGTRAALTYYSETYLSQVELFDIGVSLIENGQRISWRDYAIEGDGTWDIGTGALLEHLIDEGDSLVPGQAYTENLAVFNSGTIDEYVRVIIYRYWIDEDGNKTQDLSPSLIDLHLTNLGTDWIEEPSSTTEERMVLYYTHLLSSGETTPLFADALSINSAVASEVSQETTTRNGFTTVTTTYEYDGYRFQLEVEADAVQDHNARDAVQSAWGHIVSVSEDGTLRLN